MIDLADLRDHGLNYSDDQLAAMTAWFSALIAERDSLALKLPSWVNVADRCPSGYENVLAFGDDERFDGEPHTLWHDGANWSDRHGVMWEGVTHWMPLPEPPK